MTPREEPLADTPLPRCPFCSSEAATSGFVFGGERQVCCSGDYVPLQPCPVRGKWINKSVWCARRAPAPVVPSLMKCHKCGANGELRGDGRGLRVECTDTANCFECGPFKKSRTEAVAAWNALSAAPVVPREAEAWQWEIYDTRLGDGPCSGSVVKPTKEGAEQIAKMNPAYAIRPLYRHPVSAPLEVTEANECVQCRERIATQETEFMGPLCAECYIDALEGICERKDKEIAEMPECIARIIEAQRIAIPDSDFNRGINDSAALIRAFDPNKPSQSGWDKMRDCLTAALRSSGTQEGV